MNQGETTGSSNNSMNSMESSNTVNRLRTMAQQHQQQHQCSGDGNGQGGNLGNTCPTGRNGNSGVTPGSTGPQQNNMPQYGPMGGPGPDPNQMMSGEVTPHGGRPVMGMGQGSTWMGPNMDPGLGQGPGTMQDGPNNVPINGIVDPMSRGMRLNGPNMYSAQSPKGNGAQMTNSPMLMQNEPMSGTNTIGMMLNGMCLHGPGMSMWHHAPAIGQEMGHNSYSMEPRGPNMVPENQSMDSNGPAMTTGVSVMGPNGSGMGTIGPSMLVERPGMGSGMRPRINTSGPGMSSSGVGPVGAQMCPNGPGMVLNSMLTNGAMQRSSDMRMNGLNQMYTGKTLMRGNPQMSNGPMMMSDAMKCGPGCMTAATSSNLPSTTSKMSGLSTVANTTQMSRVNAIMSSTTNSNLPSGANQTGSTNIPPGVSVPQGGRPIAPMYNGHYNGPRMNNPDLAMRMRHASNYRMGNSSPGMRPTAPPGFVLGSVTASGPGVLGTVLPDQNCPIGGISPQHPQMMTSQGMPQQVYFRNKIIKQILLSRTIPFEL